jgi:hypothetical protein
MRFFAHAGSKTLQLPGLPPTCATTVTNGYDLGYHVYALKDSMAGWNQPLSEMMLNSVYTLWSTVLSNDDFIAMVSAVKKR